MKTLNNIRIIGIDHGYGNIKTANTITPTGVIPSTIRPAFGSNILRCDGMYYSCGEGHKAFVFYKKGFQVLFAVHTDTRHIHAHFLVSNCNMQTGKSFRRGRKELVEMSEYFGKQCEANGLVHSVRENFYGSAERRTQAESQMKKLGKHSFKDELREVIRYEISLEKNRSFDDVIRSLNEDYGVECRIAGSTISYRHPGYTDKNGKPVSVRGSRLGDMFTKKGIEAELERVNNTEYYEEDEYEYEW